MNGRISTRGQIDNPFALIEEIKGQRPEVVIYKKGEAPRPARFNPTSQLATLVLECVDLVDDSRLQKRIKPSRENPRRYSAPNAEVAVDRKGNHD
jgi:hypothetical protein